MWLLLRIARQSSLNWVRYYSLPLWYFVLPKSIPTHYFYLLGSQILSIAWSYETELLVGLRANSVVAWCCPRAAMQPDWLTLTTVSKEIK